MKLLPAFLLTAALTLSLGACETDLDPNDAYRETTILYAVLDPGQPVQRVSINKAFLNTNSNAITIAANEPDSVTFPAGAIDAQLQFLRSDSTVKVGYPLERAPNTVKQPGTFSMSGQVVYQTPAGFPGLDPDTAVSYRVEVRNGRTGTAVQGVTSLPLVYPNPATGSLFFTSAYVTLGRNQQLDIREFDPAPLGTPRVGVRTQRRAGIYSVDLDFRFLEIVGTDTTRRTLSWAIITNQRADNTNPDVTRTLTSEAFFNDFLLRQINPATDAPGLRRVVEPNAITFRATAGSPQWGRYQEVLTASSAITQTTPEFTNVRGGRGLVTGRVQHTVTQNINMLPNGSGRRALAQYPQLKFDTN
ncbi:MAG: hypothetical protein H7330_15405 [Hymenobacteraceae bacterium]|nr:hypothetical protein [Hymenobacteraceae bacterium]